MIKHFGTFAISTRAIKTLQIFAIKVNIALRRTLFCSAGKLYHLSSFNANTLRPQACTSAMNAANWWTYGLCKSSSDLIGLR
jgi:hypothetical protein